MTMCGRKGTSGKLLGHIVKPCTSRWRGCSGRPLPRTQIAVPVAGAVADTGTGADAVVVPVAVAVPVAVPDSVAAPDADSGLS